MRYGPLVYNIEQADQDISKALSPNSPLTTEWRGDLLGGVMVIKGKFADGSPMVAVPNFVRTNRGVETTAWPPGTPVPDGGPRPAYTRPSTPLSVIWIKEA